MSIEIWGGYWFELERVCIIQNSEGPCITRNSNINSDNNIDSCRSLAFSTVEFSISC